MESFKSWANEISTSLLNEAIESLKEEHCTREVFYTFAIGNDTYVVAHMEGENILPANLDRDINIKHRQIMTESIAQVVNLDLLYDISINNQNDTLK